MRIGFWKGVAERKGPLERQRHKCENNIKKLTIKYVGLEGIDSIALIQDRVKWQALVSAVMNIWLP